MVNNFTLEVYIQKAKQLAHNNWEDFLGLFTDFLLHYKRLDRKVIYEYVRIAKKFLEPINSIPIDQTGDFTSTREYIRQYLDKIENPNTYRNTLACLKNMFELLGSKEELKEFKYKPVLPSFSITVPSLEEMRTFGKHIKHKRIQIYFYLGCVSAIRPEHLLRLRKSVFDTKNNMINTWQKTFGKKNFFFSFYTNEIEPIIEGYLDTLPMDSLLFPFAYRFVQDEFERASKRSGIKISPKMMRKFVTTWLLKHGMLPQYVNIITGHTPKDIIIKHYLDMSVNEIKTEYDKATQDLKLL